MSISTSVFGLCLISIQIYTANDARSLDTDGRPLQGFYKLYLDFDLASIIRSSLIGLKLVMQFWGREKRSHDVMGS